jgi:predicted amidophosphoribosyltransferase
MASHKQLSCGGSPFLPEATRFIRRACQRALDLIYPGFCRTCGAPIEGPAPLCARCAAEIRWIGSACARCGQPALNPPPSGWGGCGGCGPRLLFFDHAAAAAEYSTTWRRAVLRFKYLGDQGLRRLLGESLAALYRSRFAAGSPRATVPQAIVPQAIIAVPPHPWRQLARGRDPVGELAQDLAGRLRLPLLPVLRRVRWIPSQTSLPRSARLRNPRGAYAVRKRYRLRRGEPAPGLPRAVLLLDDVLTTGATGSECARALKGAGIREVLLMAVARSPE